MNDETPTAEERLRAIADGWIDEAGDTDNRHAALYRTLAASLRSIADEIRAAEAAAEQRGKIAGHRDGVLEGIQRTLAALAVECGLEARNCPGCSTCTNPISHDGVNRCNGLATLPWSVGSLREALVEKASLAVCNMDDAPWVWQEEARQLVRRALGRGE